jgi:hypothetical protein
VRSARVYPEDHEPDLQSHSHEIESSPARSVPARPTSAIFLNKCNKNVCMSVRVIIEAFKLTIRHFGTLCLGGKGVKMGYLQNT